MQREQQISHLLGEVASGRALSRVLAEDEGMPSSSAFWRWHMDDEALRDNLARARETGVEAHMEEIIGIADREDLKADDKRVRVDARVKRAQMIAPRKYGPKLDLTSGNEPLRNLDDETLDAKIAAKMKALGQ